MSIHSPRWIISFLVAAFYSVQHHGSVAWSPLQESLMTRRNMVEAMVATAGGTSLVGSPANAASPPLPPLLIVKDPNTYSALAYAPPPNVDNKKKPPLILVLHGAGRNDLDIMADLADPKGEHAGLIPGLIASGQAPPELLQNFAVLAPYSYGKPSFYQDSRQQLLDFVEWAKSSEDCPISFDPNRIILFGFSDGATVAVELLTTRRFAGGVICSYGFTGTLPPRAVERLANNLPLWVFHSADDVIFQVQNSDRLVQQLRAAVSSSTHVATDMIQYNRYDHDPEQLPPRVRGHSMGITASKMPQLYDWMYQLPPIIGY
jgi:predicted peptidase